MSEFDGVETLLEEYRQLEADLADPQVHAEAGRSRTLGRRYAEPGKVVAAYRDWLGARDDAEAVRELAADDAEFAAEVESLEQAEQAAAERLRQVLIPRDPYDGRDVILQVKAGAGGEESALFAGDLLRMYLRFAERQGWSAQILDNTPSDLGGVKDASVAIKAKSTDPAEGVWAHLKYEGGVHRVQRIPVTESSGRIHTSAAGEIGRAPCREIVWDWWSLVVGEDDRDES